MATSQTRRHRRTFQADRTASFACLLQRIRKTMDGTELQLTAQTWRYQRAPLSRALRSDKFLISLCGLFWFDPPTEDGLLIWTTSRLARHLSRKIGGRYTPTFTRRQ